MIEQSYLGLGAVKTQPAKGAEDSGNCCNLSEQDAGGRAGKPARGTEAGTSAGLSNGQTSLHSELPDKQMGML